jgi:purine-nucleoside phosphorylase
MESAGFYGLAMREGLQCLSVMTVSDHLDHDQHMPAAEREQGLTRMVTLALRVLGDAPAG